MKIQIKHYCRILPTEVLFDGKALYEFAKKPVETADFLSDLYNRLDIDYRKFFKMDTLSKAGFVASELLLKDFDREQTKEDMGIVFFNRSGSLESDKIYQQTIQDKDNFFPSPAVFVYTLPNIVTGEIAIRNKIHGETAFFVLPEFNAKRIETIVQDVCCHSGLKYLLTGWVEVENDEIDVCMMLCVAGEEEQIEGTPNNPKLCVTRLQQNAHLRHVNCAFASAASLDFEIIRSPLEFNSENIENIYYKSLI